MATQSLIVNDFSGGNARFEKKDIPFSFKFIKGLNPFVDPSYVIPFPKPTKVSGSTVLALSKGMADGSPWDTNKWFVDEGGNIYKETSGGSWSKDRTLDSTYSATGQGVLVFNNGLYYTTSNTLGRKYPLTSSPAYEDDLITSQLLNLDTSQNLSGNTYTVPVAISEGSTEKFSFVPTKDPIGIIGVTLASVGTGDLVMTIHDSSDNVVATYTTLNANLVVGVNNVYFYYAYVGSPGARVNPGETYHVHLTMSTNDATVQTGTSSDLSTAWFKQYYAPLVSDTLFHPMVDFDDGTVGTVVIGNERYLAVWDEDTYDPNRIIFPPGFKCHTLTKNEEYIIAGCYRGADINNVEEAVNFYWDGISPTLNFRRPLSIGAPNALLSNKNRLIGVYGDEGELFIGDEQPQALQPVPKLSRGKRIHVYPEAITTWQGLTVIGYGVDTNDATGVEQGVYAFGNKDDALPEVLAYMSGISTGTTQGTTLHIGFVKGVGEDLYIGWADNGTYGVDKIVKTDNPVAAGTIESRIFDNGNAKKEKLAVKLIITFEPLESGESITPKYKLERGSYVTGDTVSTVGATSAEVYIGTRYKEIELGFNYAASTTFLKTTQIEFIYDPLTAEKDY